MAASNQHEQAKKNPEEAGRRLVSLFANGQIPIWEFARLAQEISEEFDKMADNTADPSSEARYQSLASEYRKYAVDAQIQNSST